MGTSSLPQRNESPHARHSMDDVVSGAVVVTDALASGASIPATAVAMATQATILTARAGTTSTVTAYAAAACASDCCILGRWAPRSAIFSLRGATRSCGRPTGGALRPATERA